MRPRAFRTLLWRGAPAFAPTSSPLVSRGQKTTLDSHVLYQKASVAPSLAQSMMCEIDSYGENVSSEYDSLLALRPLLGFALLVLILVPGAMWLLLDAQFHGWTSMAISIDGAASDISIHKNCARCTEYTLHAHPQQALQEGLLFPGQYRYAMHIHQGGGALACYQQNDCGDKAGGMMLNYSGSAKGYKPDGGSAGAHDYAMQKVLAARRFVNPKTAAYTVVYDCSFDTQHPELSQPTAKNACGGHADRLKGIVMLFYVAVLLKANFFIDWEDPSALDNYLVPKYKDLDWRLRKSWLYTSQFHSKKTGHELHNFVDHGDELIRKLPSLLTQAKGGVMIIRANQFRNNLYQQLLREPMIGIHLRFGNRNPSFVDTKRHSEKDVSKFVQCAKMVEDYYYLPNTTRWFVASDSPIALPAIRQMVPEWKVLTVEPPTIVHTERSVRSLAKTFLHFVFLEHFLLARCDYIVLSESGFGATAAAWGGIEGPFHGPTCTTFMDAVSEIDEKRTNLSHE